MADAWIWFNSDRREADERMKNEREQEDKIIQLLSTLYKKKNEIKRRPVV